MKHDATRAPQEPEVTIHHFAADGNILNNPTLPLLIYEDVLDFAGSDAAATSRQYRFRIVTRCSDVMAR